MKGDLRAGKDNVSTEYYGTMSSKRLEHTLLPVVFIFQSLGAHSCMTVEHVWLDGFVVGGRIDSFPALLGDRNFGPPGRPTIPVLERVPKQAMPARG